MTNLSKTKILSILSIVLYIFLEALIVHYKSLDKQNRTYGLNISKANIYMYILLKHV